MPARHASVMTGPPCTLPGRRGSPLTCLARPSGSSEDQMADRHLPVTTAAELLLATLRPRGVDHLLANPGTDFAPLIEGLARRPESGLPTPQAVIVAHELAAISMAHGHWLASGRPLAVMVHVNVGLANGLMGIINAARDNVPMLILSGRTPL